MSDTKPMRIVPTRDRSLRLPSLHPTLVGTARPRFSDEKAARSAQMLSPLASEVPVAETKNWEQETMRIGSAPDPRAQSPRFASVDHVIAEKRRQITPVMLRPVPLPEPVAAPSFAPLPETPFPDDERPQAGRGGAMRGYRKVALGVLGMCSLLLVVAGASAAHKRTQAKTSSVEPVTSALSSPMPAEPIVDTPAPVPAPVTPTTKTKTPHAKITSNGAPAAAASPTATGSFNRVAAAQSLADASRASASCKPAGTPVQTRVRVTFAPSGNATSATVLDKPWAGTDIGRCIASNVRKASVPAFKGQPQTMTTVIAP